MNIQREEPIIYDNHLYIYHSGNLRPCVYNPSNGRTLSRSKISDQATRMDGTSLHSDTFLLYDWASCLPKDVSINSAYAVIRVKLDRIMVAAKFATILQTGKVWLPSEEELAQIEPSKCIVSYDGSEVKLVAGNESPRVKLEYGWGVNHPYGIGLSAKGQMYGYAVEFDPAHKEQAWQAESRMHLQTAITKYKSTTHTIRHR